MLFLWLAALFSFLAHPVAGAASTVAVKALHRPTAPSVGLFRNTNQSSLARREAVITQATFSGLDEYVLISSTNSLMDLDTCSSYYTIVTAGNISFRLALDTGSSDILIVSSACDTANCQEVPKYPLSYQSPSFVSINDNTTIFNISFADGTSAFLTNVYRSKLT